jgi:DNA mismatch endonuclease (patch repair protein)
MPKTRIEYWVAKIERNKARDYEVNSHYKKTGWKLFRIWEHKILNETNLEKEASKIIQKIKH